MKILGISAFYHDSAAALIIDGEIVAAVQEERFTRKKHDASFPINAIKYCLEYSCLSIGDLDVVAFYDKPFLKFERLLETYYGFAPIGLTSFVKAIPVWLKEKLFLKKLIIDELLSIQSFDKKKIKLLFSEHHLSHAASAFFTSNFKNAVILTIDGVGEWATATIMAGNENNIKVFKELKFPHSVGLLYSSFTYFLGFKVNSGEYKLMGLAPYGNPDSENTKEYIDIIKEKLISIKDDGSIWLNQSYFRYATGLKMTNDKRWEKLFGIKRRLEESKIEQHHCDLAYAIQNVTEEIVVKLAKEAKSLTNMDQLCFAGGVALNCVANGKLLKEEVFKDIYIQPAAGDAGCALGAALAIYHIYYKQERKVSDKYDNMKGAYLGPEFSDSDVLKILKKNKAVYSFEEDFDLLAKKTAELIAEGKIIGWFQGKMEFGPRALGNRSILGDARQTEMQKKLNLKIKYREGFRPFAPSVLDQDKSEYFDLSQSSPYMLLVANVNKERQEKLPDNYYKVDYMDRLYTKRSDIQAVTHVDFSARIQTVHKETNPRYYRLIESFKEITGYGLLVNTSFNVRGEPIVCNPSEAYRCFMRTEMDYLVIGNYLCKKTDQPSTPEDTDWKENIIKD